jgi:hypothetical protein
MPSRFLILFLVTLSGCALVGNVRPVDEKSQSYAIADLSKQDPDWKRLPASGTDSGDGAASDVNYQSQKTASIVSLNSSCRPSFATESRDLRGFSEQLLLGISEVTQREEENLAVEGSPALQTTVFGKLNGEPVALRTVVVHRGSCVYDLMYVARPERFKEKEADFSRFVRSLRLK